MDDFTILSVLILTGILIIVGFLLARYGNNKSYEIELSIDQIKDYFLRKHYCKDCNTRLKRISKKKFLGEGWSNIMDTYSYSKKYKVTYYLSCPSCNRRYTSDDY